MLTICSVIIKLKHYYYSNKYKRNKRKLNFKNTYIWNHIKVWEAASKLAFFFVFFSKKTLALKFQFWSLLCGISENVGRLSPREASTYRTCQIGKNWNSWTRSNSSFSKFTGEQELVGSLLPWVCFGKGN